ncbi:asparagine synthase (glutamine-hydrolyzing) [Streptomyces sp. NPDC051104]|uniref:asparagine synthase (glutamine-hydrolyzing) n=1 Tax=Streptomyces sp. NPDC051104 TaxID=3155044 RepID=UPI0034469F4D
MCGIAGQVVFGRPPVGADFVGAACAAMRHRGPDETAVHRHGAATLGIARLRIIGLVGGEQPARDAAGSVACVVNGEIYNHRALRTLLAARGRTVTGTSDAHVVPELYAEFGDSFVDHLSGMFAIALYDTARERLLLVTDRFGKKPLFYGEPSGGGLAFASELPALMTCPGIDREVDPVAVDQYLSYRVIPAPHTIYRGASKLPPATMMVVDREGIRRRTYWTRPFDGSLRGTPTEDIVDRVDALLRQAITDRLKSEVPLGAMLSGGLDSSLVVALARRTLGDGLHTFSIGFDSPQFDERREAEAVAAYCGTRHHYRTVRPDEARNVGDLILRHMGEPYGFPSAIASWAMYELASRHVTVVLTGDGSDEMFCGYARYQRLQASQRTGDLADRYESVLSDGVPGDVKAAVYHPQFRDRLPEFPRNYLRDRFARTEESASDLERAMQVDATFWLSDAQLVKIDRMAMAHSVEPRSPMLDHSLVEYVRGIPAELNLESGVEKQILKQVAARYLPPSTVKRRKQELAVPLEEWLTSTLRPLITDTLLSEASLERGYFAPDRLRQFVTAYRPEHSYALWTLYMLERWHRLGLDGPPEADTAEPTVALFHAS